jgi:hypothetical protein
MVGSSTFDAPSPEARASAKDDIRSSAAAFVGLALQLVLIVAVTSRLAVVNTTFERLLPGVAVAFAIHYWLPLRLRLPVFVLFSLLSLAFVLGLGSDGWEPSTALQRTSSVLVVGLCLIAICRLPISFLGRIGVLTGAAGALALWRIESVAHPMFMAIWPVLGSMFMFRLMLYMYEVENEAHPPGIWRTIAYFFMLPNACFPLYPVVDWRAFGREYYNDDAVRIYQTGLRLIVRGLIQCIGYQLVLSCLYCEAERVTNGEQLARHIFSNYALYLRVSGQFHIVAGVLHLFGWNLGATNRQYFLADSFTDYWRRVNIYWKQLMLTVFYNPVAYRVRRTSAVRAVLFGSVMAFAGTWFLHGYQAFWLTGSFRFSLPDTIFWATLGALVVVNANREARSPRARKLVRSLELRGTIAVCARTVAVFATLCTLWSLWSCRSCSAWVDLWRHSDATFWMWTALVLLGVFLCKFAVETAGTLLPDALPRRLRGIDGQPRTWAIGLLTCGLPLAVLWQAQDVLSGVTRARAPGHSPLISFASKSSSEYTTGRGYYEDLLELSAPRR